MVKILLIRHALTDHTGKKFSGRLAGISLNEKGKKQAEMLAQRLSGFNIDAIYCSPLERAVETAVPLAQERKLPCLISEDFNEADCGKWTNMSFDDLKNDKQFFHFNTFRSQTRMPEGESVAEVQMRMIKGIEKLQQSFHDKTIAIFSHADPIKCAIAYFAGIPIDMIQRVEISPASVSIINLFEETVRISLINDEGNTKD